MDNNMIVPCVLIKYISKQFHFNCPILDHDTDMMDSNGDGNSRAFLIIHTHIN